MSSASNHSDPDHALAALADEIIAALAARTPVDLEELAQRFDVTQDAAEDCHFALMAFEGALGEDLPGAVEGGIPDMPEGYDYIAELGRGGMGVVYRVHHRALGRDVALKVVRPGDELFGDSLARFRREARSLARLRHRHIVSVHEVGEVDGYTYFTMDYVAGHTLHELVAKGDIGTTRAVGILGQVTSAIEYAHRQGVIHRDLKPSNILVDDKGDAFVVDFGLARDAAAAEEAGSLAAHTATGQLIGTPAYMSPEQARGDAELIGEATDVYALGAILYECIVGRRPFGHRPLAELIAAVLHEEPDRPSKINPKIPRTLEVVCQHAMHKDPAKRYPTAKAFGDDLERFALGRSIRARPPTLIERGRLWSRRHRSHILTAVFAVLVAIVGTQIFTQSIGPKPVDVLVAEAEELADRGEFGGASSLYEQIVPRARTPREELHLVAGLLEVTASRVAELRRLKQVMPATALVSTVLAQWGPATLSGIDDPSLAAEVDELSFQRLRLVPMDGTPTDVDRSAWSDYSRLVRDLQIERGVARDPALILLASLLVDGDEGFISWWRALPLSTKRAWLIDAVPVFDPSIQGGPEKIAAELLASPRDGQSKALAALVRELEWIITKSDGIPSSKKASRRDFRLRVAMVGRLDADPLELIWEKSYPVMSPTELSLERRDELPGNIEIALMGEPFGVNDHPVGWLGHTGRHTGVDTKLSMSVGTLEDPGAWKGTVVYLDIEGSTALNLVDPQRKRVDVELLLELGQASPISTTVFKWQLGSEARVWTFHLLVAIDGGETSHGVGLDAWRGRLSETVRAATAEGARELGFKQAELLIGSVIDLELLRVDNQALELMSSLGTSGIEAQSEFSLYLVSTVLDGELLRIRMPRWTRDPMTDSAWVALQIQARDPAADVQEWFEVHENYDRHRGLAKSLRRAIDEKRLSVSSDIRELIESAPSPRGHSAWWDAFGVGLLLLAILIANLVRGVVRWGEDKERPWRNRHTWSQNLVGIAFVMVWIPFDIHGFSLPGWVIYGTAAAGGILWTREQRKASRAPSLPWLPAVIFASGIPVAHASGGQHVWAIAFLILGAVSIYNLNERSSAKWWEQRRRRKKRRAVASV